VLQGRASGALTGPDIKATTCLVGVREAGSVALKPFPNVRLQHRRTHDRRTVSAWHRSGSPCVMIGEVPGRRSWDGIHRTDHLRCAAASEATGTRIRALPDSLGGVAVDLVDPAV